MLCMIGKKAGLQILEDLEKPPHQETKRLYPRRDFEDKPQYKTPEEIWMQYLEDFNYLPYPGGPKNPYRNERDRALVAALYVSGLRISELLSVRKSQVQEEEDFLVLRNIKVLKQHGKTKLIDKGLPRKGSLAPFTELLLEWIQGVKGDAPLFDMKRNRAHAIVKQSTGEWPHYFRHQYCSYLINGARLSTAAAMGITGHSSPNSLGRYSHGDWREHKEELSR